MRAEQPSRIPAIAKNAGNGVGRKTPSPMSVKYHPPFPITSAAEAKVPPKLNSKPIPYGCNERPRCSPADGTDQGKRTSCTGLPCLGLFASAAHGPHDANANQSNDGASGKRPEACSEPDSLH